MHKIDKTNLEFLAKLEIHNNREWFDEHKSEFKVHQKQVKTVFEDLYGSLNSHDVIDRFKMFRIYRDVRFSKNKLSYKTHFAASYHRKKPELRGGYYIQVKPNNQSFIATGFWNPEKKDLFRIRKEFEQDDQEIRDIINSSLFKSVWGNKQGDELKTAPRNFDKNHHAIDLIRRKQFIFTKTFSDEEVLKADFIERVNESFIAIRPFFNYMSDVLTTDLNGQSLL